MEQSSLNKSTGALLNNLAGFLDRALNLRFCPSSSSLHGEGRGDEDGGGLCGRRAVGSVRPSSSSSTAPVRERWRLLECLHSGGRRPAFGPLLLISLVEWRPCHLSSQPLSKKGGSTVVSAWRPQYPSPASLRRRCGGRPPAPSGVVPGDSGFGPELKPDLRTELHFSSVFWGPFCMFQGPGCIFRFLLGLSVNCAAMLI